MLFNTDKCKVVHFGYKNSTAGYLIGDISIKSGSEEKELGIIISSSSSSSSGNL